MNDAQLVESNTFRKIVDFIFDRRTLLFILGLSCGIRISYVLFLQNPMDWIQSDAARHWDNAGNFLNPGPMGCANPVGYQLYLFLIRRLTGDNRILGGLSSGLLSLAFVAVWTLLARELFGFSRKVLVFGIILSSLPSSIVLYGVFMSETLLLPLLGLALLLTLRFRRAPSTSGFMLLVACWIAAVLSKPLVLPLAVIACVAVWLRLTRRFLPTVLAACLVFTVFTAAARHSYEHFHVYRPFGNEGPLVMAYFFSGARAYSVQFMHGYYYIFESPSFNYRPFAPLSDWIPNRKGIFSFKLDRELAGDDMRRIISEQIQANLHMLPRLIAENIVFMLFGPMWPGSSPEGRLDGRLTFHERWIWCPLILVALFLSLRDLLTRKRNLFSLLVATSILSLLCAQLTVFEGRYRKPLEPLVLLYIIGALHRPQRTSSGQDQQTVNVAISSAPTS